MFILMTKNLIVFILKNSIMFTLMLKYLILIMSVLIYEPNRVFFIFRKSVMLNVFYQESCRAYVYFQDVHHVSVDTEEVDYLHFRAQEVNCYCELQMFSEGNVFSYNLANFSFVK